MAYEQSPGSREKLNAIHDEIRRWIEEESDSDPNVKHINVDDLKLGDLVIAQQIHIGNVTEDEWNKYTNTLNDELKKAPEDIKINRGLFHRLAGNRANTIIGDKLLEEMERKNNQ